MASDPIQLHKTKHLLTHVLTAAVRRRWATVGTGDSGETREGFFVDLLVGEEVDVESELPALETDMRRILAATERFAAQEITPAAARALFSGNPIKHALLETIDEWDQPVRVFDLDGVIDVCDCALKDVRELRAIEPACFDLLGALRLPWRERARSLWVTRITGLVEGAATCVCPLCQR